MKTYTRKEISKIVGIPWRRISFYVDQGCVKPEKPSKGRGYEHGFGDRNRIELGFIRVASKTVKLASMRKILDTALEKYPEMFERITYKNDREVYCIVIYEGTVFFGKTSPIKVEIGAERDFFLTDMTDHDHAVVINMSKIVRDIF